jgi:hypothetical protein
MDSFHTAGAMSVARPGITGSATSMDGRFLAAGGTNFASTEMYGFATVKTDAADYPPGSTVTITGSGWQPGETVGGHRRVRIKQWRFDQHQRAVADPSGNIVNTQFSPDEPRSRYSLLLDCDWNPSHKHRTRSRTRTGS